jgi:hypothetical protein
MNRQNKEDYEKYFAEVRNKKIQEYKAFNYTNSQNKEVLGLLTSFQNCCEPKLFEINPENSRVEDVHSFVLREGIADNGRFPNFVGSAAFVAGRVVVLVDDTHRFYKKINLRLKRKIRNFLKKSRSKSKVRIKSKSDPKRNPSTPLSLLIFDLEKHFCDQVTLGSKEFLGLSGHTFQNMQLVFFGGINRHLRPKKSIVSLDLLTLQMKKSEVGTPKEENQQIRRFASEVKILDKFMLCGGGFVFDCRIHEFLKGSPKFYSQYQEMRTLLNRAPVKQETFLFWLFVKEFSRQVRSVFIYGLKSQSLRYFECSQSTPFDALTQFNLGRNTDSMVTPQEGVFLLERRRVAMAQVKEQVDERVSREFRRITSEQDPCFLVTKENGGSPCFHCNVKRKTESNKSSSRSPTI